MASEPQAVKELKITCVSELGWQDDQQVLADAGQAGGLEADQWAVPWSPGNAAGSCSLLEMTMADGGVRRILLDAGWGRAYMARRLADTGVAELLKSGQVELLYFSHEHMDHLWGAQAVLELAPAITIAVPSTFSRAALEFLAGRAPQDSRAANNAPSQGRIVKHAPGPAHEIMPGVYSKTFDLPIILGVRGEQSLFVNVAGKGVVAVSGCCHQGPMTLLEAARETPGGAALHGLYGGLHLAPFGPLSDESKAVIGQMAGLGLAKVAANHCTGQAAVAEMKAQGLPVQGGTGSGGSRTDLYLGNGDAVAF